MYLHTIPVYSTCLKRKDQTSWGKVLLEKLTVSKLINKFPRYSLPHSQGPSPTSVLDHMNSVLNLAYVFLNSFLILSSHLRLTNNHFPSEFRTKILHAFNVLHACYVPRPSYLYYLKTNSLQIMCLLIVLHRLLWNQTCSLPWSQQPDSGHLSSRSWSSLHPHTVFSDICFNNMFLSSPRNSYLFWYL
jgi:hypothetical protein